MGLIRWTGVTTSLLNGVVVFSSGLLSFPWLAGKDVEGWAWEGEGELLQCTFSGATGGQ